MDRAEAASHCIVPVPLCHVLGTLPSIYDDRSLGVELLFHLKTSDYLVYDPEKLWKDLQGKKGR